MLRTFADGRLFGSSSGQPPARVLALHGWARTHHDFDAVLLGSDGSPALDAIALDLPGFGATPPPPEPWGATDYAESVAAVIEEMGGPAVVLAHSFGGRVAVELAAAHPDKVQALVLTGVPLLRVGAPRRPARGFRLVRRLHRAGLISEDRMEAARQRHGSPDYRAAQGIMRQVFVRSVGERYDEALAAIACPVTLVWGDNDAEVPLAVAEAALAMLQGAGSGSGGSSLSAGSVGSAGGARSAELVVCPGAGHLVPLTAPNALRAAVERFVG